jgi:hypothetical protein
MELLVVISKTEPLCKRTYRWENDINKNQKTVFIHILKVPADLDMILD